MTAILYRLGGALLGAALLSGCVEPFTPDGPATAPSYLVVDGFINSQGSTVIKLSRTLGLAAKTQAPAEAKATVAIQDNVGEQYLLTENPAGTYTSAALTLPAGRQYHLRIATAKGLVYVSDALEPKTTPAIDDITWKLEDKGVSDKALQLYVSTHDAAGASRYYRWDYTETWEFVAAYYVQAEFRNTTAMPAPQYVFRAYNTGYHCWRSEPSTAIRQSSTAGFSQDRVADYPLRYFNVPNQRLWGKYSILVRQYAQSPEEYGYWETLRKNTESVGTINDPLPSQLTGNVHAQANAAEPVLGFVGVRSATERRLFIDRSELPKGTVVYVDSVNANCRLEQVPKDLTQLDGSVIRDYALQVFRQGLLRPVEILTPTGDLFSASTLECIDCRTRGTATKPSFWP